jgi:hypothetical protein
MAAVKLNGTYGHHIFYPFVYDFIQVEAKRMMINFGS